jgi:hypothetical protein
MGLRVVNRRLTTNVSLTRGLPRNCGLDTLDSFIILSNHFRLALELYLRTVNISSFNLHNVFFRPFQPHHHR